MTCDLKKILLPGKKALVVGLGRSGASAVEFLLGLGLQVAVSEGGRRESLDGDLVRAVEEKGVSVETGGHTSELFCSVDAVLVSPGVPLETEALCAARSAGIPVFGELALARDFLKTPVVGISGTNGKSTVTTLVGALLATGGRKVFVGGNIGVPLTSYLTGKQDCDWAVLELSSYQLDGAEDFRPEIGVLLNISPDHLDRYPSYQAYINSKMSLFRNQRETDTAIVNGEDREIALWLGREQSGQAPRFMRAKRLFYGREERGGWQAFLRGAVAIEAEGHEEYQLAGTGLDSAPNDENALASILAARAAGCSPDNIRQGLANFQPLPHRLALVCEKGGVAYYDDSKATNIGAVYSALSGFTRPVVLIAGGRDKGASYEMLAPLIQEKVRAMVLIGEAKEKMAAAFAGLTTIEQAEDMEQAVNAAAALARPGDAVLLSPACASFDMFQGYDHRGEVFRQAVATLAGCEK